MKASEPTVLLIARKGVSVQLLQATVRRHATVCGAKLESGWGCRATIYGFRG